MAPKVVGKEIGTECTYCKGTGKLSKAVCKHCDGEGISKFYYNYIRTVKNSRTRELAIVGLRQFAAYLKVKGYRIDNFADLETFYDGDLKILKNRIIGFISYLEEDIKHLKRNTIANTLFKVKGLYEMNEITLPWRVIMSTLKERTGKYNSRGYEADEIKQLVDNSNLCYKAVILLLASSGIRLGGIDDKQGTFLKVRDLEEATKSFTEKELNSFREMAPDYSGNVGKITVYRGSEKWEYETFCTPEAYKAINTYLQQRKDAGEIITPESPLFRTEFNPNPITYNINVRGKHVPADVIEKTRVDNIKHPEPLRFWSVQEYVDKRLLNLKIANRKITNKTESNGRKIYNEVPIIHGFRKFTGYTMDAAGVNDTVNELLMGHKLPGMREQYRKWPQWRMLAEYWKAVPDLTIDKTNVLKVQVQQAVKAKKEVEIVAAEKRGYLYEDHKVELKNRDVKFVHLMTEFQTLKEMYEDERRKNKALPYKPYKPTPELPEIEQEDSKDREIRELKERLAALENKG